MQLTIVILLVASCVLFLGYQAFRYFKPKPNAKLCAGNCCDTQAPKPQNQSTQPPAPRLQMISSDDLRNRLQARK